jgi:hypothetical protein
LFSVEASSSVSCIMFWLALRSGYALGDGQQAAERAVELFLRRGQLPHGGGVAGAGPWRRTGRRSRRRGRRSTASRVSRSCLKVALGGFHQVGDQVEPALELDVDLGEGVLESIPRRDQAVVDTDTQNANTITKANKISKLNMFVAPVP